MRDKRKVKKTNQVLDTSKVHVSRVEEHASKSNERLSKKEAASLKHWLQSYRQRWSCYWNYMSNISVEEIIATMPSTIEQLASIENFGESKAKMHGEHILATLYAFLASNCILHRFPEFERNPPTLESCPLWTDPTSEDAQRKRQEEERRNNSQAHKPQQQFQPQQQQQQDYQADMQHLLPFTQVQQRQVAPPQQRGADSLVYRSGEAIFESFKHQSTPVTRNVAGAPSTANEFDNKFTQNINDSPIIYNTQTTPLRSYYPPQPTSGHDGYAIPQAVHAKRDLTSPDLSYMLKKPRY
jgi:hypothetical protein